MNQVFENLQAKDIYFTRVTIMSDQNLVTTGSKINFSMPVLLPKYHSCKYWWKYLVMNNSACLTDKN